MELLLLLAFNLSQVPTEVPKYIEAYQVQAVASTRSIIQSRTQQPSGNIVNVRGFLVDQNIATKLEALLAAAAKDGVTLTGTGYRDKNVQVLLRMQNCGQTYYDIYEKPEANCQPSTAIPGTSMHEKGLAVDFWFTASRETPTYKWLAGHAASYGLYNRSDEAWHWSVNGK